MNQSETKLSEIARLPEQLKERCRTLNGKPVRADSELVLYWMHHAVRGHENPALEVAIALAEDLDLPVLLYQGLGGNHPYNNDRHHAFILQGARDAHRELRECGIRAVVHLDRQGDQPSPLRQLVDRAAALIAEDFPDWARETLLEHASDPRPLILDTEALARSRTGDALWDLAQTSLRVHGELHNNLRMTWAKAIIPWRPDPQATLDTLLELNHRYALDGSDPNSYGGLLWALGLFDRPFPDAPVTGTLRSRSTQSHARRLDLARYGGRISQPSSGDVEQVAVIGAGISGLAAARTLHDQGHRVTVFEKSRGPGGRAATRRLDDLGFDHGAQYFTARDPAFRRAVAAWRERGLIQIWDGRIGKVNEDRIEPLANAQDRYVGVPGMSAIGKHLAVDLTVHTDVRVAPPQRINGQWRLQSETGEALGDFDLLIIAVPAPQAQALLTASAPELAARAASVQYAPAWALMLAFDTDPPLPYDGLFFEGAEISWAARNSSKPGRFGKTWVVHASPAWTRDHIDVPADQIGAELTQIFAKQTGIDTTSVIAQSAHRWLHALVDNPLDVGALWDPELGLGLCGDWCYGARIEGGFLSGQAIAGRILGHLANDSASGIESANLGRAIAAG